MRTGARIALLALVVVIAVVGFIVVGPDEASEQQTREPAEPGTTQTRTTRTQPGQPPSPSVPNVRVRNGRPVGGVQELEFEKGETAEFFVRSDVADHVHVHGYDLMKDVTPGKPVKFAFEADIDGQFEVELENRHVQIATLRVEP